MRAAFAALTALSTSSAVAACTVAISSSVLENVRTEAVWSIVGTHAGSIEVIVLSPDDFTNSLLMNRPVGCSYW